MTTMHHPQAALEVENLHKSYDGTEVLKGVSLTAHKHEVISIIGSSGSGKSTFLRCINLLEQPHSGKILLNGEELKLKPGKDGAYKPPSGSFETVEDLEGQLIVGSPDEAVEQIKRFEEVGTEHLVFDFRFKFDRFFEQIELLGTEVLPKLR